MNTNRRIALCSLLAASLALPACQSTGTTRTEDVAAAEPVELPELVRDDWSGKVVVVDFWATWCGPCKASSPNVQILHERFASDPDVLVVGVHADDNVNIRVQPRDYIDEHGYTYPIVERGQTVGSAFGVHALPTFVVLDAEGREVMRHVGMMNQKTREEIAAEVERLRG